MKVANLGRVIECEECSHKLLEQGHFDVIEVAIGNHRMRLCSRHFAEMLVLGQSSLPRDRRATLAS